MDPGAAASQAWFSALNLGFIYVAKRDNKGRPVIVLNVERLIQSNVELEPIISVCDYLMTFTIEKLMVPGLIETLIMIVDLNNVGATSIPLNKVKGIIGHTSKFFKGRMHKQFTINAAWLVRKAFSGVTAFLDDYQKQKLTMLNHASDLVNDIPADCLEQRYGGRMPNIAGRFFPPDMQIPGQTLLTQKQLYDRCPLAFKGRPDEVAALMPKQVEAPKQEQVEAPLFVSLGQLAKVAEPSAITEAPTPTIVQMSQRIQEESQKKEPSEPSDGEDIAVSQ